jgi:predicted enzyme related to lactoylglutathione lyase
MKIPNRPKHAEMILKPESRPGLVFHALVPVLIVLIAILAAGCGSMNQRVHLPPVAENTAGKIQDGHFAWIDLLTEDTVAAASFYSRLFGWRAARSNENGGYYLFYRAGQPVAGMTSIENKDAAVPESLWLATIAVSDVEQRVAAVKAHGGKVLEGPLDAGGRGSMVLVSDPAGAAFVLLAAGGRGPAGAQAAPGQWLWIDLFTRDANRAPAFYTALFGYEVTPMTAGEGHRYRIFKQGGRPVAGLVELSWAGLEDNWLPYFKVADVDRSIEKARDLGGKLILKSSTVAVLADSTGAAFGIQASR